MVDTRNKRASCLGLAFVAALVLPAPDGTVAQADRQQAAYSYAGIAADSPVPFTPDVDRTFVVPYEDRAFVVPGDDRTFTVPGQTRTFTVPGA